MKLPLPLRFHAADAAAGSTFVGPQVSSFPAAALEVCVIIPAKNEAQALPATLSALAAQVGADGRPIDYRRYEIILLANNCTDATARVASEFGRQHPQLALHVLETDLPAAEAHVGRARRLLMDEAAARLEQTGRPRGIIASTDADTRVAPTWLAALLAEFQAGADAVGGRILPEPPAEPACAVRRLHLRDAAYRLGIARLEHLLDPSHADPWPRHHQHFGGSLALTVAAYRRVGGLPVVPYLEDEALWRLLQRHDLRLRHSPAVQVRTSARQQGRVAVGLSWQLHTWAQDAAAGREPLVEHPQRLAAEYVIRRELRALWQQRSSHSCLAPVEALAQALGVPAAALRTQLTAAGSFGDLWEAVRAAALATWEQSWPALPLGAAAALLRQQLQAAEASAAGQKIEAVMFCAVPV